MHKLFESPVLQLMKKRGIALTRRNFIAINWLGNAPQQLDAEDEDELPRRFQRRPRRKRRRGRR